MAIRSPEKGSFSLFRRLSENPASVGTKLTRLSRVFGTAALLAIAAGCGEVGYEPNGRRLGGSMASADGGPNDNGADADVRTDSGERFDGSGRFDGGPDRDGGREDSGEDSGPSEDAGREDAGREDGGREDGGREDGGYRTDGGSGDGGDGGRGPDGGDGGGDGGRGPDGGVVCPPENCRVGIGICERTGTVTFDESCVPVGCDVAPGPPAESEDCTNGLDDDCSGEINDGCAGCVDGETFACYTGGEDTRNRGACHDGNLLCGADGRWGSCEDQQTPADEICGNGLNEDCDLETDEGCGGGVECFAGEGICRTAGITRADGSCDAVPGIPEATDLCGDGLDNDCVNGIDDGCVCPAESAQLCYQGSFETLNVGVCRPGTQICIDGRRWSPACEGQVLPSAEQCNGADDNCNRATDENLTRPCSTACGDGIEVCRDGAFRDCNAPQPQPEVCNGADDNCNNRIDEDIAPRVCSTICGGGTEVCRDGVFRDCNAPTPQPEICNGADDNCNGATDESCPCTAGRGICERDGTVQADGRCNAVAGPAGIEICNGADDNCNGATDETFPEQNQPCTVGLGACERTGEVICEPPLGARCNVLPGSPNDEECNAIDDDCDTFTDEDIAPRACSTICGGGTEVCRDGVFRDCSAPTPQPEECNGADDNCNGSIDEDFSGRGAECFVGIGFCRRTGELICEPGHPSGDVHCSELVPGDQRPETCNGVDDNCNGNTDETFPEMGVSCSDGVGECRRTGTLICTPGDPRGNITCSASAALPGVESCNRLDDDCDSTIDNGCFFHRVECATTPVLRWDSDADAYRREDPIPDCGADGYRSLVIRTDFRWNYIVTGVDTLRIGLGPGLNAVNVITAVPPLPADLRTLPFTGVNADLCPEPRSASDACFTNAVGVGAVNIFRVR